MSRNGTKDFDGDGFSDFDEYLNGTDPTFTPGDVNGDEIVDLSDAILALQVSVGMNENDIYSDADASRDRKIGTEEVIYVLQRVADMID